LLGTLAGGLNGVVRLDNASVQDDGTADSLTGGAGNDWFVTFTADGVTNLEAGEIQTTY
jgi:hypothetical protein